MHCESMHLGAATFDTADFAALQRIRPQLVLAFFSHATVRHAQVIARLQQACADTHLIGCSSGGQIGARTVTDDGMTLTAIRFDATQLRTASTALATAADSAGAGASLARTLAAPDLRTVLVFAQGGDVDGRALVDSLAAGVGAEVNISGGLAVEEVTQGPAGLTWTLIDGCLHAGQAVAVGLYGAALQVRAGMAGGATPFGPVRKITRASGNLLYELDGEPALDIYRRYLGAYAEDMPATALMFPFALLDDELRDTGLIRSMVCVDESQRSLTLAGDVELGSHLRLMHANTSLLTRGATAAALAACPPSGPASGGLALLVSCVDPKLVMGGRVDDEIDAVADVFGPGVTLAGFYANGEFSPAVEGGPSRLNNQTMAITYLCE